MRYMNCPFYWYIKLFLSIFSYFKGVLFIFTAG